MSSILSSLAFLLAVVALAANGDVVRIAGNGVSVDLNPLSRQMMRCNNEVESDIRLYRPAAPAAYLAECANECARRRWAGLYPCTAFIFRSKAFSIASKRDVCTFFSCTRTVSAGTNGVFAVVVPEAAFATASPSMAPTDAPTASPTQEPTTMQPTRRPTRVPTTRAPSTRRPTRQTKRPTASPGTVNNPPPQLTKAPSKQATPRPTRMPSDAAARLTRAPTQPTSSPVWFVPTNFPTEAPTSPTPMPTYFRPTFAPFDGFQSPSGIPRSAPFTRSLFVQVNPNFKLCQVVRPQINSFRVPLDKFYGTQEDCMKECQYDNLCQGVLFSKNLGKCVKAVRLELADDTEEIDDFEKNWVSFNRVKAPLPYYQGYCSLWMSQATCAGSAGTCKWNFGIRGYNQNRHTDTGYCGRQVCNRSG